VPAPSFTVSDTVNAGEPVATKPVASSEVDTTPKIVVGEREVVTLAAAEAPVPVAKVPTVSMGVLISTPENAARIAVALTAVVPEAPPEFRVTVSAPATASMA